MLLGEQRASKTRGQGSNPCVPAGCPWSVTESHPTLRRSWTRFDSWRGHSAFPVGVSAARRPSKPQGRVRFPGGGSVPRADGQHGGIKRPRSVPDPHTTLRRSETRFDSWRGHVISRQRDTNFSTLEPDGQAAGCNPAEVGSTPTGVSRSPNGGSPQVGVSSARSSHSFRCRLPTRRVRCLGSNEPPSPKHLGDTR